MTILEAEFWDGRYAEGSDGWTLDGPPHALLHQAIPQVEGSLRVLVPGAGQGHDAFAWARAGHQVTALDFAPRAVVAMRERAARESLTLEVIEADVTAPPSRLRARFDLVWEQTCLCALAPDQRRPYLEAMRTLLAADGRLCALLWNHGREGGPPYDLPDALVEPLIEGLFRVERREAVDDEQHERKGQGLWWLRPREGARSG